MEPTRPSPPQAGSWIIYGFLPIRPQYASLSSHYDLVERIACLSAPWYIFRDSADPFGPLSSSEIREALRHGTLDPFDLVAREGSTVRRPLVEVDEIFDEVTLSQQDENDASDGHDTGGHLLKGLSEESVPDEGDPAFKTNAGFAGQGQLHLAAPLEKSEVQQAPAEKLKIAQQANGNRPKQFYLSTGQKNRQAGPYGASEIAAMFHGKSVPFGMKVIRMGLDQKPQGEVPLARFMRLYSSHQSPQSPGQGAYRRPYQPTSELAKRVRAEESVAKDKAVFLAVLAMIMFIAAFLVIAFSVIRQTRVNQPSSSRNTDKRAAKVASKQPIERVRKATNPVSSPKQDNKRPHDLFRNLTQDSMPGLSSAKEKSRISQDTREKIIKEKLLARQKEQERKTKQTAKVKAREEEKREEERSKPKPSEPRPSVPVTASPQPAPPKVATPTPLPVSAPKPVPATPPATPPPANPPPPPAPPPSKPPPSKPPTQPSALADGTTATRYGPLSCPKATISSCEGSCTVACSGPQGTVTIMFFKGVWGTKIEAKSASVYVSGFVRVEPGSGPRIIVSDVQ